MTNEPLGLPKGSVRGIIAILITITISISALLNIAVNDIFMGLLCTIIGFYFGVRTSNSQ